MQNKRYFSIVRRRFLRMSVYALGILFGLASSCCLAVFATDYSVYADTYSASLSGAGQVNISLMGSSSSNTASSTVTANTTCPNGYTISINGANDNDTSDFNLYLDGDDSNTNAKFIPSSGVLDNPAALSANSWGVLVNNNLYAGITTTPVPWFIATTQDYTPGVNKNYTLTYGAFHDGSLPAGTYSMTDNGRVVYTLEMDNTCTSYTVEFDANEPTGTTATGTMNDQTITEGVPTPLTTNAYEIAGYAFTGWNTAADGSGTSYADGASVTNLTTVNTTITLYAQWSQNIIQNYANCPFLETGDTELLTDIRDGKTYWIAKMADGHCWMTQNLDLDLETTPSQVAALTSENTDLNAYNVSGYTSTNGYSQDSTTEVITWTPERATLTASELTASNWAASNSYTTNYSLDPGAYYYTDQFEPSLSSPAINLIDDDPTSAQWQTYFSTTPFSGNGVHGHVGNYYTWSAAVASNDTSGYSAGTYGNIANNPKNSICPAGWRLPLTTTADPNYTYQGSFDETKRLNYVLNNNQNVTNSSAKLESAPFYMTRAGYVDATEASGPMTRGGRGSGIWTSTINNSSDAKTLYEAGSSVTPASNSKRNLGYPVRCISRDEAIAEVRISFQANEPAGAGTATGTMLSQSVPIGLTVALNRNAFELSGYLFAGWNTSADGTGTSYADGAIITPSTNVTLYAQWTRSYSLIYDFGDESFDGASILNTNIALFDTNTINKDFTLSFDIGTPTPVSGQSDNFNNFAAAMSEAGSPWPGFAIRFKTTDSDVTKYRIVANASTSVRYESSYFNNADGATVSRKSGLLYANNGTDPAIDFNLLGSPFNSPLTFGAGLNSSNNPFRFADVDLSDIQVRIEYANQDTVTLPNPTKTNDVFLYWNTAADGTGTIYSAGTTITMTGSVTLYPIWQSDVPVVTHDVTFLVNTPSGAPTPTGSMSVQTIAEGVATNLSPNNFAISGYAFMGWNTAADGTGTPYADEASVTLTADLTLYAQWLLISNHTLTFDFGNESFVGSNYIDTKIGLFSSELRNKDFVLSFGIANQVFVTGQDGGFNNIANAMKEGSSPWPGFVVRLNSTYASKDQYNFNANATTASADKTNVVISDASTTGFKLERINGSAYLNNSQTASLNFDRIQNPFDTPLTLGAGLNSSNQPFRYSKVDLSNIKLSLTFNNLDTYTLPSPTKTNDTFLRWNTASDDSGTSYNAGDVVTMSSDLTLYPIWLSNIPPTTHQVIFLANVPSGAPAATGTMPNQNVPENVATNLNTNNYAIAGYTFTGWNTAADGSGTPYANGASVTINADLTLYAQWVLTTTHTLTYNFGNESFDGTNYLDTNIKLFSSALNSKDFDLSFNMGSATYIENSDKMNNIATAMSEAGNPYPGFVVRYGESNNTVTKYSVVANASTNSADKKTRGDQLNSNGFRFRRISGETFLNSETSVFVDFNHLENAFDSPLVFGAGLNKNNQLFRFSKIDLSNIQLTLTFDSIDTVTLPSPVKPLYAFIEWNTVADGSGTSYSAGDTITMSSDLTLYPIWEIDVDTYEVTFHANEPVGTATGSMPPQTLYDGFEGTLNTNTFALQDYVFLGWNTAADGSGTNYADGAPITITGDIDLYARWLAEADIVTYTVTYNIGDETFDGTNYLRTGIQLFDDANVDRSFDIDFNIDSFTYLANQDSNRNAFVTAMDESVSPFPGFVLRYADENSADKKYSLATYSSSSNKPKVETAMPSLPASVSISRSGRALSFNNSSVINYSDIAYTFSRPLVFGASINKAGNGYYRHFQGSLSDITVGLKYTNIETVTVPSLEKPGYTFLEWNTVADGSGTSYAVGSTFTPSANLTLYPIWNIPIVNEYHEINLTSSRSASSEMIDLTGMGMGNSVSFVSDNTGVATVDASGTVTAVAPGEATITVVGNKRAYYNVYVSEPNVPLFNITPEPIQVYYNSRDAWDVTKTKADFLANMRETFENYRCKIYNYSDNNGHLDSAIAYGWTDGTEYCDQSRAYDTGETGALNVYLYDTANSQTTGNALDYTGAVAGKIYNMIPGETYYWELASDTSVNGLVKATGKHRILNFTQGDMSRVSGQQITRNTREIGGLPVDTDYNGTIDGYTEYGKIFRAERLWTTNGYNADQFTNLGATFEIDVRGSGEGTTDSRLPGYRNTTVVQYAVKQGVDTSNYNTLRGVVTQAMQDVIDGKNIYFHCSYGSDRTGTLAWVLEGLLGVTDEYRLSDYELSTFYGAVDRNRYFEYEGSNTKRFTYMMTFLQTGQQVYDWYMYGTSNRASDEALINNFRAAMISYTNASQNSPQNQPQNAPEQNRSLSQEIDNSSEPEAQDNTSSSPSDSDSESEPESSESGYVEPLGVTTSTEGQDSQSTNETQDSATLPVVVGVLAAGAAAAALVAATKIKSEE